MFHIRNTNKGEVTLETYVVLYNKKYKQIQKLFADDPLCFICEADDDEHAREQCLDAYPDCHIVWVDEFNADRLYSEALESYYYELENLIVAEKEEWEK